MACDLATKAEDEERSLAIIDQMGQAYAVDVLGRKADALGAIARSVARRRGDLTTSRQLAATAEHR